MSAQISLEPVDAANVTVLVDNFVDALLPSGEVAQRPQVTYDMWERGRGQLIAEHGLSLLLTVDRDGRSASLAKFGERPTPEVRRTNALGKWVHNPKIRHLDYVQDARSDGYLCCYSKQGRGFRLSSSTL